MRPLARVPAALLAGLPAAPLAGAQLATFPSGADLVLLSATAVDRHGRPVTDLRREEIRIFEDGRPPKGAAFPQGRAPKGAHFPQGRAAAARLLLLLDASGSMQGELKTTSTRMAALQILAAL